MRILFVAPNCDMFNPSSGQGTRLNHLSRGLAESHDVYGLVPHEYAPNGSAWLRSCYTYDRLSTPFLTDLNPSFVSSMATILREQDIDVVHLSIGVCATKAIARTLGLDTIVVYAAQNVEADLARDFVDRSLPIYKRLLGPRLIPAIERLTVRCCDRITTVSEADRDGFVERYGVGETRISTVPTGTQAIDEGTLRDRSLVRQEYGLDSATVAVFHGSHAHPPNREAVELIVEHIAPAIRERGVDLRFLLVGKGMPDIDSETIRSVGFVDDLPSTLNAADFAVVPILHGAGTKTKIYDYVSLGLPIVSTTMGVAGIEVEPDVHCLVTQAVDEAFVRSVTEMATNDERRSEMGTRLRSLARELSWDRSVERLRRSYRESIDA